MSDDLLPVTDEATARPEPSPEPVSRPPRSVPGSDHVRNLGLDSGTSDGDIFAYARDHGFAILSKDSDFRQVSFVRGAPPKVVWLRVGNCTVAELREMLHTHIEQLHLFDTASESFLVIDAKW